MSKDSLFSPLQIGAIQLRNRIIMAPLTRMRAGANHVPTPMNADYYAQRASAGLIITEGTAVSDDAHGYPNAPGIYTAEQIAGWRAVTNAVHARGGRIMMQIAHNGRNSHSSLRPDGSGPYRLRGGSICGIRAPCIRRSLVLPHPPTRTHLGGCRYAVVACGCYSQLMGHRHRCRLYPSWTEKLKVARYPFPNS
jgi:2,4-dienoyl-CoA reductase-like NADH-dependent reductase (Old Yellow Enzyme family)